MKGRLIFETGEEFFGDLLTDDIAIGEVVFNTAMTGYQEIITDPSYCDQIINFTYPLIGNYGVNKNFNESNKPYIKGIILNELCSFGSNWEMEEELKTFFNKNKVPVLYNVDTRAITKFIRSKGSAKGIILPANTPKEKALTLFHKPLDNNLVKKVSTEKIYEIKGDGPKVVVMDFGIKKSILKGLIDKGFHLIVVPYDTSIEEINKIKPDGLFLSNGPGDPMDLPQVIDRIKVLAKKYPTFGICLGHQLISIAFGCSTYKMKFGHRGSNHPVKDIKTGKVYITSQNHGYAVDFSYLENTDLEVSHISLNDNSIEGVRHKSLPIFSVQYHPEGNPGTNENYYLFQEFKKLITK